MKDKKIILGIILIIIAIIGDIVMIGKFTRGKGVIENIDYEEKKETITSREDVETENDGLPNNIETLEAIIKDIDCDREEEYENEDEYTVICKYTVKARITDEKYKDKVVTVKFQNTEYHGRHSSVAGIYRDWQNRLEEGSKIYIYKRFGVWKLDGEKTEAHMFGWDEE